MKVQPPPPVDTSVDNDGAKGKEGGRSEKKSRGDSNSGMKDENTSISRPGEGINKLDSGIMFPNHTYILLLLYIYIYIHHSMHRIF